MGKIFRDFGKKNVIVNTRHKASALQSYTKAPSTANARTPKARKLASGNPAAVPLPPGGWHSFRCKRQPHPRVRPGSLTKCFTIKHSSKALKRIHFEPPTSGEVANVATRRVTERAFMCPPSHPTLSGALPKESLPVRYKEPHPRVRLKHLVSVFYLTSSFCQPG